MAQAPLVGGLFEEGADFLRALDRAGFPVEAAFWLYDAEAGTWKYYIATQLVDKEGPLRVYKELQKYIPSSRGLTLPDIAVISPRDHLMDTFRSAIRTPADAVLGVRFTANTINNVFIDDAYIYRIAPSETSEHSTQVPLSESDSAVLKVIGDLAVEHSRRQVAFQDIVDQLSAKGIDAERCSRSIDFLAEQHLVEGRKYGPTGWAVVWLTLDGMETYATHFIENYPAVRRAVAQYLVQNDRTRASQVAQAVKQPSFVVNHIVAYWEAQGLLTATQVMGGDWIIVGISETLRRLAETE